MNRFRVGPISRRTSVAFTVGALLILAVANVLWFGGFSFRTIMGDDLYAWAHFSQHPSFQDLFLTATDGKYRPVVTAVQGLLFRVFSADYRSWVAFNIAFNLVNVCLLFALIRRLTRGDTLIAFLAALLYITSRFAYYNIVQVYGVMEALGILFLLLILHVAVDFLRSGARWPGFALAGLYLLVTMTHERYLVLFPFLALLALFKSGIRVRAKVLFLGLFSVPVVLDVVLKSLVFHTEVLMGTGGQTITFDPIQVGRFVVQGLANMLWINWGPDYLSGINISEAASGARVLVLLLAGSLAAVVVLAAARILSLRDSRRRRAELQGFVLWLVLFVSLLLAASITIRQEYRWLYAPFVVCLACFCCQLARLPTGATFNRAVLIALAVLAIAADSYYRQNEGNVFFFYGEQIADSTYDATMGHYGLGMRTRTVYVEKTRDVEWVLGGTLFLVPYLGADHQEIVWVDDLNALDPRFIDPAKSVLLRMDWSQDRMVDVTSLLYGR